MERLTKYGNTIHENGVCCTHFMSKECHEVSGNCAYGCKWEEEAWSKLAKYEDLEEQGRLIVLPCKPNETVWSGYDKASLHKCFYASKSAILSDLEDGYVIGRTKEEAEKALAEMGHE